MTESDEQVDAFPIQVRGGLARAKALSPTQRREIAKAAAAERWHGTVPRATHEGTLLIGDLELPCAVIESGQRLLSETGVLKAFGLQPSGTTFKRGVLEQDDQTVRLPMYVAGAALRPFIDNELITLLTQPVMYRTPAGGPPRRGLDASLIPKVCDVWMRAREAGVLRRNQMKIAERAVALIRALAHTGIIALVDEATGYEEVRDRYALQAILDAYLSRELAAWAKRFPDEYYHEIFRLRNWAWDELRLKAGKGMGPRVIGKYTNDFIYARLAPGVLEELQRRNPVDERGKRRAAHHQWLTQDVGHPALAQHLHAVIGLMRASETWEQFQKMINKAFPRRTDLKDLPLFNQTRAALPSET